MSGRALWKGYIQFGGVSVPVKLHAAVREEHIQFHLLHKRDHVKLKQQMVCAYEKAPVPAEEQAKGFELEEGRYIVLSEAELERTEPADSRVIEVHEFVKSADIDPIFRERAYYLQPDDAAKGYRALAAALGEMGVEGICTWTMRKRSYLGALQASGKLLRLQALRHADEVISAEALKLKKAALSEKELEIGSDLISRLVAPFQPEKFENEHQKKLQGLIDRKLRGERIAVMRPRRLKPTASDELLEVLQASLRKTA